MTQPFQGKKIITSDFAHHLQTGGVRAQYAGTDYALPIGTPMYAIEDGTTYTGIDGYGALWVILVSTDGRRKWEYLHLDSYAKAGQVKEGDTVGQSGNTGYSTGPHLHFSLTVDGVRKDPEVFFADDFTDQQSATPDYQASQKIAPVSQVVVDADNNQITIPSGWGWSHIARELGWTDWATQKAWDRLKSYNPDVRILIAGMTVNTAPKNVGTTEVGFTKVVIERGWGISHLAELVDPLFVGNQKLWDMIAGENGFEGWESMQAQFDNGSLIGKYVILPKIDNITLLQDQELPQIVPTVEEVIEQEPVDQNLPETVMREVTQTEGKVYFNLEEVNQEATQEAIMPRVHGPERGVWSKVAEGILKYNIPGSVLTWLAFQLESNALTTDPEKAALITAVVTSLITVWTTVQKDLSSK